jgi:hypothetical protein
MRSTHNLLLIVAVATIAVRPSVSRAEGRYWALFRDGTCQTGDLCNSEAWDEEARLGARWLFDPANPVRVLCDKTRRPVTAESRILLASGDTVPGRVCGFLPAHPEQNLPDRLVVQLAQLWHSSGDEEFCVRADRVVRIVSGGAAGPEPPPGTVVARDAKKFVTTSTRWSADGLHGLTDGGVFHVAFDELVDFRVARCDALAAARDDAVYPPLGSDRPIVRLQTVDGGVVSFRRAMARDTVLYPTRRRHVGKGAAGPIRYLIVSPAWATGPLLVPIDRICRWDYRRGEEVPLPALPATVLREKRGFHFQPWRRNCTVQGGALRCGELWATWGVGTHSHSEIAFALPSGAHEFTGWVGIDAAMLDGGCARAKIYRDQVAGEPLFQSGLLTGGQPPTPIAPLDLTGTRQLILVTEFAHDDRPAGADPLDIRDNVNWLMPTVRVEIPDRERTRSLCRFMRGWQPWSVADGSTTRWSTAAHWDELHQTWFPELRVEGPEGLTITRVLKNVAYANDLFEVNVAPAETVTGMRMELRADGDLLTPVANQYVSEKYEKLRELGRHIPNSSYPVDTGRLIRWNLQEYRGRDVTLDLKIAPGPKPADLIWRSCRFHSAVSNLPAEGKPLQPDVRLTSLKPTKSYSLRPGFSPAINCVFATGGRRPPITFLGQRFDNGIGMRSHSWVVYTVEPSYRRFVAVVGCCAKKAGPFRVLLDQEAVWSTGRLNDTDPAVQVDIEIPHGTGHLTIEVDKAGGAPGIVAWADAGFIVE